MSFLRGTVFTQVFITHSLQNSERKRPAAVSDLKKYGKKVKAA